jgi:hypothetical protein
MKDGSLLCTLSRKLSGYRKWIALCVLVLVGASVLCRGWGATERRFARNRILQTEIPVQISPVIRKHLTDTLEATGDITPMMQIDPFPKVSGYPEEMKAISKGGPGGIT